MSALVSTQSPDLLQGCPITPLGSNCDTYFFLNRRGEIVELSFHRLQTSAGLGHLFGGRTDWLMENFPKRDASGRVVGFSVPEAAMALMAACAALPVYSGGPQRRGYGVWPTDGTLVCHCGSRVLIGAKWEPAGVVVDGIIYAAESPHGEPSEDAAIPEEVQEIVDVLRLWNFANESAAELVMGYAAQAFFGAAHYWRAHLLVTGARGSGKSWLCNLLVDILGPMGRMFNDATAAGLRQSGAYQSVANILDEAETGVGTQRLQRLIEFTRLLSSGAGIQAVRGSAAGQSSSSTVVGSCFLAAINPPELQPQDRSRFTEIAIGPLDRDADPEIIRQTQMRLKLLSPRLWRRALDGYERFKQNFELLRKALIERGCDPRQAEQPATLLAGYNMMVEDKVIDQAWIDNELQRYSWAIQTQASEATETAASECWRHLLMSLEENARVGERRSIGSLIVELCKDPSNRLLKDHLAQHGLRLKHTSSGAIAGLWVANVNPLLLKIYAGSRWASEGWGRELKRLEGASAEAAPIHIGPVSVRVTLIPVGLLPPVEEPEVGTSTAAA